MWRDHDSRDATTTVRVVYTAAMMRAPLILVLAFGVAAGALAGDISPVDGNPGPARALVRHDTITMANRGLGVKWVTTKGQFVILAFRDEIDGPVLKLNRPAFLLTMTDGKTIRSSDLRIVGGPAAEGLAGVPGRSRWSDRLPGKQVRVELEDAARTMKVVWHGVLRDGSNYIRQELTITAIGADLPLKEVRLIDLPVPGCAVAGKVIGSPIVAGNLFLGFEYPLSKSTADGKQAVCSLDRALPLAAGQSVSYSSVIGVAPKGQMRRAFLNYIERERAHPYRTFLHYNSWYDLGYGSPFNEGECLKAITGIGEQLVVKRKVKLDSLLFDDGWDDPKTLWGFHSGFPQGFTNVKNLAAKYGAAPGVWMSPWGGYGEAHDNRIRNGREQGFEIVDNGFALSGPVYYKRFHDTCVDMIRRYDINQFKFDGTGNVNQVVPGSKFGSDFEAMMALITDLRRIKPDLFVNLTTGTWPTPFWTRYADSIWRGGGDNGFSGVGSNRQKWITYRDGDTYRRIVQRGPLYPLNSLMLHGLLFARFAPNLSTDPNNEFVDEIRSYFGSGTQLQEMYLTPSLLSKQNWDDLAEAAKWSRANADVLVDTHWVGGDPLKLQVYGWAAWSPKKATLVLRNPSNKAASIDIDVQKVLELPSGAPERYLGHSPWASDRQAAAVVFAVGRPETIRLRPFEVLTFDLKAK